MKILSERNTIAVSNAVKPITNSESYAYLRRFNIVLTIRSIVILLFVAYLISGPVANETDIVASVVALSLVCLIGLLFIIALTNSLSLRSNFEILLFPPEDAKGGGPGPALEILPGVPARFVFKTSPVKIFPGFVLKVRCEFASQEVKPAVFHLSGQSSEDRLIIQDLTFPHRGLWKLTSVQLEYGDRLELTHYQWDLPKEDLNQVVRVGVQSEYDSSIPVISSASRPGEAVQDLHNRQGDHYDIKAYHPADGVRKILWKIYAKSGALMSRHPETSMTPEGEVAMFVLADKQDDHVCSANLAYLQMLEQLDLQICLSCEGGKDLSIATNPEGAMDLFIESVWNTEHSGKRSTRADIQHMLDHLTSTGRAGSLQRMLLFCSEERLSTEVGCDIAAASGHYLEERGIKPVYCIAREMVPSNYGLPLTDFEETFRDSSLSGKIVDYFRQWTIKAQPSKIRPNKAIFSKFMITCANNDWQVFS